MGLQPRPELSVTFFGVRGSTPCCSPHVSRYGGNTSSVVVEAPGCDPLLLDLGTGVRVYGETVPKGETFVANALVSHLHWDHVQGLPFFGPALAPTTTLHVHAPAPGYDMTLEGAIDACIRPPFFPVGRDQLLGIAGVHEVVTDQPFPLGGLTITAARVPHVGATVGYRIEWQGVSVAYIPDHQQPVGGSSGFSAVVDEAVLRLAAGVDLLIHDAQYTDEEFVQKATWGHSTLSYAVEVARQAGAATLALFHHDPMHDDDTMDRLGSLTATAASCCEGLSVITAHEGLRLSWPSVTG
ncbi:MAG: MBL fold metallo-hydrolase [Acidimicrobiales bacterium]